MKQKNKRLLRFQTPIVPKISSFQNQLNSWSITRTIMVYQSWYLNWADVGTVTEGATKQSEGTQSNGWHRRNKHTNTGANQSRSAQVGRSNLMSIQSFCVGSMQYQRISP